MSREKRPITFKEVTIRLELTLQMQQWKLKEDKMISSMPYKKITNLAFYTQQE